MRLAAALALTAALAQAAPPTQPAPSSPPAAVPPASNDESTVVSALEIVGRFKGPAMWTVRRGDAQVTIVGGYSPLPHSLEWDKGRLSRLLDGADAFYEAKASVGPLEMAGLFLTAGSLKLGRGHTLDSVIGPARAARLRALAPINHADPAAMQSFKPAAAGVLAYQTFVRTVGWSNEKPQTTIRRLVRDKHVPERTLTKLAAASVVRSLEKMEPRAQLACFDATLDQTEQESAHGLEAARAWAEGSVGDLRRLRSTAILDHCLMDNGGARAVLEKGVADATASIQDILRRPGTSVAVLDIELLASRGGVLDRLKAQGFEIGLPPE